MMHVRFRTMSALGALILGLAVFGDARDARAQASVDANFTVLAVPTTGAGEAEKFSATPGRIAAGKDR